jgi:N-acetylglucosamine malate deacetylase 1
MRPYPHPRSKEALTGLAAYRGGQAGLKYAEAFQAVFQRNIF